MFGEKAFELIKELKRAPKGQVPPYNVSNMFDKTL